MIIDIERGVIMPHFSNEHYKNNQLRAKSVISYASELGFPKSTVNDLLVALRDVFPFRSYEKADYKIEQVGASFIIYR